MNTPTASLSHLPSRQQAGVTLIEVLAAILIMGVIVGLGGPSFVQFVQNTRVETRSNAVLQLVNQARGEAAAQRRIVTVCGSLNGAACNATAPAWSTFVVSFLDCNGNGAVDAVVAGAACNDRILQSIENGSPGVTTRVAGFNNDRFSFNTQGFLVVPGNGTIRFCDSRGATSARAWLMTPTGRLNTAADTNNPVDGVVNDHTNANVTCP
ncbi:GspH/FimT family pseudopilin [uncultured Hydrogenophaga sp.]|uniref:GspH/FimT family pseudopilin n=1 Tax=uncultured Hydrogenophaga sp. TaxID=199683 RepID=UPI00265FC287|nr:GspH/FimT family pseudopilin [uncultured Hydrogenophaga sp.]